MNVADAATRYWYAKAQRSNESKTIERITEIVREVDDDLSPQWLLEQLEGIDMRTYMNAAFVAGATYMLHEMTEISPYVQRFIELLIALGVREDNYNVRMESETVAPENRAGDRASTGAAGERPH